MKDAVELAKSDALWRRQEVAKEARRKPGQWTAGQRAAVGGTAGSLIGGATHIGVGVGAGSAAKKGRGLGVGARAGGRSLGEGAAGGLGGAAIGSLARKPALGGALATGGAVAGTIHGAGASIKNSRKKGWLRPGF